MQTNKSTLDNYCTSIVQSVPLPACLFVRLSICLSGKCRVSFKFRQQNKAHNRQGTDSRNRPSFTCSRREVGTRQEAVGMPWGDDDSLCICWKLFCAVFAYICLLRQSSVEQRQRHHPHHELHPHRQCCPCPPCCLFIEIVTSSFRFVYKFRAAITAVMFHLPLRHPPPCPALNRLSARNRLGICMVL